LEKRRGDCGRCKLYKVSSILLGFHFLPPNETSVPGRELQFFKPIHRMGQTLSVMALARFYLESSFG